MKNAHLINNEEMSEVVKEVREIRHKISAECGHDLERLIAYHREIEKELRKSGKYKFVESPNDKPEPLKTEAAD
ncbi:hypothetical protein F4Y59_15625 [Candidatus Poribacteria bacterium]|nr:hypothetical protein [Candidatus Poribacteria bacterium]MYK20270.1 hypothetical protein [Candidatus Poribacteria bacterium]